MQLATLTKEFRFDCQARELSPKTIANYQKQIRYFMLYLEKAHHITALEDVRPIHVREFIVHYKERGSKPAYVNDLLKAVKCLLGYAHRENYTPELITQKVKNMREPKVLIHTFTKKEISSMIDYFKGNDYLTIRNRLIMMLLFDTGIRVSELMEMTLDQIQDDYILIHGKGRKERLVPQSPIVAKWIMRYLEVRDSYFEYHAAPNLVFLSKNAKPLTDEAICVFMKSAAEEIKVSSLVRVSPHTCRHTFAHQQLRNGLDLYSLSRLLGHESVSITQRYLEGIKDTEVLLAAKKTGVLANL